MKSASTSVLLAAAFALLPGCNDPLSRDNTDGLRRQVIEANKRQLSDLAENTVQPVTRPDADSYLEKDPERVRKLDEISGPGAYRKIDLPVGRSLDGEATTTAAISLEHAIRSAVNYNLDIQIAQLQPAISEAELARAEAAFDAIFFTDVSGGNIDTPRAVPTIGGIPVSTPVSQSHTGALETGIRKPLESGGQLTVSTGAEYTNNKTPGLTLTPDPAYAANVFVGIEQPLLRNFGSQVNRAQIALSRNAHHRDVLALHAELLNTTADVEQAYWSLVFARHRLAIQQALLQLTVDTHGKIVERQKFDASPVQMAQSQAFVEGRRQEVIRARQDLRTASDELKRLINDPSLPLSGETLLVPADEPIELPLAFSLLDSVTTALKNRPEVRAALLDIDDASIRQQVADNQRLPQLNLSAGVRYRGLDDNFNEAYNRVGDGDFIEYLIGGQFEAPIGNRAAEADFRRTRIQRQQAVVGYKLAAQESVASVKTALRSLDTSYELIGVTRSTRRAAAENLRAVMEREEQGEKLTPEFLLDLKLNTQQRLADSEIAELQALINYNVSIARLHQATGTLLEHNQIDFEYPLFYEKR